MKNSIHAGNCSDFDGFDDLKKIMTLTRRDLYDLVFKPCLDDVKYYTLTTSNE